MMMLMYYWCYFSFPVVVDGVDEDAQELGLVFEIVVDVEALFYFLFQNDKYFLNSTVIIEP